MRSGDDVRHVIATGGPALDALCVAPRADVSPLMLAARHAADAAFVRALVAGATARGSRAALARRDARLRGPLHAAAAPGDEPAAAPLAFGAASAPPVAREGAIGALLDVGGDELSASAEDAHGVTPCEQRSLSTSCRRGKGPFRDRSF